MDACIQYSFEHSSSYTAAITVTIGEEGRAFVVHSDLIGRRSRLLETTHLELVAQQPFGGLSLKNVGPEIFEIYLESLYNESAGLLELARAGDKGRREIDTDPGMCSAVRTCQRLCKLWVLGDVLQDARFKIDVIKMLLEQDAPRDKALYQSTAAYVWKSTQDQSGLRRWLIDSVAVSISANYVKSLCEPLPKSFMLALLEKLASKRGDLNPDDLPKVSDA